MIICCERCDTKYRLDASMISTSAVKVQCSKCSHIFIVPPVESSAGATESQTSPPDFETSPNENSDRNGAFNTSEDSDGGYEAENNTEPEPESDMSFTSPDDDLTAEDEAQSGLAAEPTSEEGDTAASTEPAIEHESDIDRETNTTPETDAEAIDSEAPAETFSSERDDNGEGNVADEDNDWSEEKPNSTENDSAGTFDLTFNTPEKSPSDEDWKLRDTKDEVVAKESHAQTEVITEETTATDTPDTSTWSIETSEVDDNISHKSFDLTFNAPDKTPAGEVDTKKEFFTYEAAKETHEPLAKFYIDKSAEETAKKADREQTPEESASGANLTTTAEDNKNFSFSAELSQAEVEAERSVQAERPLEQTAPQAPSSKPAFTPPEKPAMPAANKSSPARLISLIVIILAIAGGVIYMKTRPNSTLMATPSREQSIRIESTKGYYVMNKESGRIFVIESMIKNISEKPIKISGIRGLVLDSSGDEMARRRVSPGRIVSAADLRTQSADKLLRSFRDTSEGTIPQKAIIPTMILFPDLGDAVAEYGIDVLR